LIWLTYTSIHELKHINFDTAIIVKTHFLNHTINIKYNSSAKYLNPIICSDPYL